MQYSPREDRLQPQHPEPALETEMDPDDPDLTTPLPRYNAMLSVLRNTLYMYVLPLHFATN